MSAADPTPAPPPSGDLPATVRYGYGVAAFANTIANASVLIFLLKFLVDGAGLNPALAGGVLLVAKVWDAAIDPLIGRLTDRTRTRWGVRRPWIAGSALPLAVAFALLWQPWPITGMARAALMVGLLVLYSTAYSCVTVPYASLTPVLARDYDARTRLTVARMGASMIGGIFAGVCFPYLLERGGWSLAGIGLAACIPLPLAVTVYATRGRDAPLDGDGEAAEGEAGMLDVLRVGAFLRVAALFVGAWSTMAVLSALLPFYVQHILHQEEALKKMFAAIQLTALATLPLVGRLAQRIQKHRAYAAGMLWWAAVLAGMASVPEGGATAAIALGVLAGPGMAAAYLLPWAMMPDVVAEDQRAHGRDRAGAFYGMLTFIDQTVTALALQCVGIGLEIAGYAEGAPAQPPSVQVSIRVLLGVIPALVLIAVSALALLRPPVVRTEATA